MAGPMPADDGARRLEEIFHDALELPTSRREAFLLGACGGDDALHRRVRELLDADEEASGGALPDSALAALPILPDETALEAALRRAPIGPYRITRRLASGGMGTVYEAVQDEPRRTVAL